MARWRVYVKPFLDSGEYASEFIEVTKDVISLGAPKQGIDNTDFDVGVIRNSGFNVTLRNDHGHYSDVTELLSMFRYKRKNSLVKITWDIRDYDLICGFFQCGHEPLGGEYVVFEGLIHEVTSVADIAKQEATFAILGYEALLDEVDIPFSSLSVGNTFATILYASLNQAPFNTLVTVSLANITPSLDLVTDAIADLENKTVGSKLKEILLAANSVLYIKDSVVYVTPREESTDNMFTFYGQASNAGIENILNVPKFRDGMNRVFNYWKWAETILRARDTSSITTYGIRDKEISCPLIADGSTVKVQQILDANRDEFSFPKVELEVETPIWYTTLALRILDKVNIDYPTIFIPFNGGDLPRYGLVTYDGTARYPYEQWTLTINSSTSFKIMSRRLDIKKQTITFGLREV